jgi:hypothetical protein
MMPHLIAGKFTGICMAHALFMAGSTGNILPEQWLYLIELQ